MIIDAHTHLGGWKEYFNGLKGDPDELLKIMKDYCIDKAIVCKSDGSTNQDVIKLARDIDAFIFFWWAQEGDDFLKYKGEINGFKIHPTIEQRRVDYFREHLMFADDNRLPVIVHCGRYNPISSFEFALDTAGRYKTNFILAHMGGATPEIALRAIENARGLDNVFFGIEGIVEPWLLKRGVEILGAEHFIFGSDFPISHPKIYLDLVNLACEDKDKYFIYSKNILKLLIK